MGFLCRIDIGPTTLVKNMYVMSIKMLGQIEDIKGSPSSLLSLLSQSKPSNNFSIFERLDVVALSQASSKGGIISALVCDADPGIAPYSSSLLAPFVNHTDNVSKAVS